MAEIDYSKRSFNYYPTNAIVFAKCIDGRWTKPEVTNDFKDIMLRPLAEYIHRFLVFGALYDWYAQFDMGQAGYYGKMASDAQDEIGSILAGPAIVKRPLQPFGPAEKIY